MRVAFIGTRRRHIHTNTLLLTFIAMQSARNCNEHNSETNSAVIPRLNGIPSALNYATLYMHRSRNMKHIISLFSLRSCAHRSTTYLYIYRTHVSILATSTEANSEKYIVQCELCTLNKVWLVCNMFALVYHPYQSDFIRKSRR